MQLTPEIGMLFNAPITVCPHLSQQATGGDLKVILTTTHYLGVRSLTVAVNLL